MNSKATSRLESIQNSDLLRFLLLFASGWAGILAISYFYNVLAMFIVAAILAILMDFPVRYLSKTMPRWLAIVASSLAVAALILGFIAILGFQVVNQGSALATDVLSKLRDSDLPFTETLNQINLDSILSVLRSSLETGFGFIGGAFSNVLTLIFLPVISLYMLVDDGRLWISLLRLVPARSRQHFDHSVQKNVLGFLRGQMILVLFLSISSFVAFTVLGVKFSLVLAIIIGVLDAIPGIGATFGVIIISSLVFVTQGPWTALSVVVVSIVLQQIQDNLIHPKVMGKALNINPVVIFFALFIGERVAGLLGVFLAIPIAGMIVSWSSEQRPSPTDPTDHTQNIQDTDSPPAAATPETN
ncbi:AI-2E family transporter [Synechococcus sp. CS-602]|nr:MULTISPECIES: AI-2E family transporter [unclassified Synechococcus]MCT0203571.1 AI-2E family transporter [Synechococcus sp. CS-602]MCT0245470.1 AI-2E family transporter [Synechococcus sp. CS-601]MCT4366146.1 AI-2E family transporter [Candidatus Regnicoccus frigidus MAG-AL2]APD48812.1 AI-2E family transporter [Synechococcus sp. SynAce01]MCT0201903.1 AI-2E family transporter [Synechococcus sp. CS-603]